MNGQDEHLTIGVFDEERTVEIRRVLADRGNRLIEIPVPLIVPIEFPQIAITDFEWVIFADIFASEMFLSSLVSCEEFDEVRVCAVGESVAERLRVDRIHSDIIPDSIEIASIISALLDYQSEISDSKLLLIATAGVLTDLAEVLAQTGATVIRLEPSALSAENHSVDAGRLRALVIGGGIDALWATDSFDAARFALFLAGFPDTDGGRKPEIVSSAPIVMRASAEFGFKFRLIR